MVVAEDKVVGVEMVMKGEGFAEDERVVEEERADVTSEAVVVVMGEDLEDLQEEAVEGFLVKIAIWVK